MKNICFAALLLLGIATSASAQQPAAPASPAPPSQLIVERMQNGWLVAPDARVADLDGGTGALAGAYGGYVIDGTLLVGGGGYWLANGDRNREMAYGGALVEWMVPGDRLIGFGVRSLVGGGTATMPVNLSSIMGDGFGRSGMGQIRFGRRQIRIPAIGNATVAVRDDFFVFEPQVNLLLNLTNRYRVSVGVGYRVIGAAPILHDRLEGLSGAVSFRIGGF